MADPKIEFNTEDYGIVSDEEPKTAREWLNCNCIMIQDSCDGKTFIFTEAVIEKISEHLDLEELNK